MPGLALEKRLLHISNNRASPPVDELRRVCVKGSPDAVLRALGEAALADAASEAQGRTTGDAPELTQTAWEALMRSAPQQARQASAQLLALVPGPDSQPQLFEPSNGAARDGSAHRMGEALVPVHLTGAHLVAVSQQWALARASNPVAHPAMPLARVWAERQCMWIDYRESRILPAAFAAGFVALNATQDPEMTLWPVGPQGTSPNVAGSPLVRLAIEIGCGIPYGARSNDTVLLPPLTVTELLAMLYPPPLRPPAWRRNRWGRVLSALRRLERMCSAGDPQRRPVIEILSDPGTSPAPDDEVRLAVNTPTSDNGPRLLRDAVRSLGRSYGRGLWLVVSAARCWDRLIAQKGQIPCPARRGKPTASMNRLPTVSIDEMVAMCRWPTPGTPAPMAPAAVSRARSAAAATVEALADSGWLTLASEQGWHGAHSERVGPERSAAGVIRSTPVRIVPAPWWTEANRVASSRSVTQRRLPTTPSVPRHSG